MNLEVILEALVAVLLAVTVVYCFILNRRLSALRGAQEEMLKLTNDFSLAMTKAQAGIHELRQAGAQVGQELQERVGEARAMRDELKSITQTGNDLADRLEHGLVGGRRAPSGGKAPATPSTGPATDSRQGGEIADSLADEGEDLGESRIERELREAIRRAR